MNGLRLTTASGSMTRRSVTSTTQPKATAHLPEVAYGEVWGVL